MLDLSSKERSMQRITVSANINTFSGYGIATIEIIKNLVMAGYDVNVRPLAQSEPFGSKIPVEIQSRFVNRVQQEEWEVMFHPPDHEPVQGKKIAYFTMWESTKLPPEYIANLNKADLVITPSTWNATCFNACGVTTPIRIVPLGIDPEIFYHRPLRPQDSQVCTFGTAGRMAHGGSRKGMNEVIDLFLKAFPDEEDVRLKVKGFEDCEFIDTTDPRVEISRKFMSNDELARWLASLTCFVSGAKGEGWGLLQHEAMAVGRPVIAAKYGGLAEFMECNNSYPVRFKLQPSGKYYKDCGLWAVPDDDHMIATMHQVYENRDDAVWRGFNGAQQVKYLNWQNTVDQLLEVFKEFGVVQ
jgi:glycosyltransferase involved in cell wall biosynthesis